MFVCLGDVDYNYLRSPVFSETTIIRVLNTENGVVTVATMRDFMVNRIPIVNLYVQNYGRQFQFVLYTKKLQVSNKAYTVEWFMDKAYVNGQDMSLYCRGSGDLYMLGTQIASVGLGVHDSLSFRIAECRLLGSCVLFDVLLGGNMTSIRVLCAYDIQSGDYGVYNYIVRVTEVTFNVMKGVSPQFTAKLSMVM